ncbi:MAG: DsbA family oxidoreductase [Chitinophagaceae bacterium]|nr:DsbA family oxidoreductase [Chitinophagaceae bacterium]
MKVEIWSDIVCPFCYIGKRRFEKALASFSQKDKVEVVYRSFQLDPDMKPEKGVSVNQYLANRKGIPPEQAKEMNEYVTSMAKAEGLLFDFDKAVITNTLQAHRLLQLAKAHGLQPATKEKLMSAYFTEGKDVGDENVLLELGKEVGLPVEEIKALFANESYKEDVELDQYMAQQLRVQGVPFFVFNNKYAVSGAQAQSVFAEVLEKAAEQELAG